MEIHTDGIKKIVILNESDRKYGRTDMTLRDFNVHLYLVTEAHHVIFLSEKSLCVLKSRTFAHGECLFSHTIEKGKRKLQMVQYGEWHTIIDDTPSTRLGI